MVTLHDKKRNEYSDEELVALQAHLDDYLLNSRNAESQAVESLEKHLWLANGAGATAAIGFIQAAKTAKTAVSLYQFAGAWLFIAGIAALIILKFFSEIQSSRVRYRFQKAHVDFESNRASDIVFRDILDTKFKFLRCIHLSLRLFAGIAFLSALAVTLISLSDAA